MLTFATNIAFVVLILFRMKSFWTLIIVSLLLSSCSINKDFMFRHDEEFVFDNPIIDSTSTTYTIVPNDVLEFDLYTNNGAVILEFTTSSTSITKIGASGNIEYVVDNEGYTEFPVVGRTYVRGLTVIQLQDLLEQLYSFQFNAPYAKVKVLNRRIVVYNGAGGPGSVVPLGSNTVNLIEALALSGGLSPDANSTRIKLFRKVNGKQEAYIFDLSTIEGIRYSNFTVLGGDIIYVDSVPSIGKEALADVQPYVQLLTSIALTYAILARLF